MSDLGNIAGSSPIDSTTNAIDTSTVSSSDNSGAASSWTEPLISTKHIPLGTRLFILCIMLVIIAFTTYLFYYRTDNVSVSFAQNYPPGTFYQS